MNLIAALKRLRHGPVASLGPVWVFLGDVYRSVLRVLPRFSVSHHIGGYGPFHLDAHFAFSNFEAWGSGHNRGFAAMIEACRGASCVLDVGGHIGLFSLPASRMLAPGGHLYIFEPAVANLNYLHYHITRNRILNAEVVECLVGDSNGPVTFFEQAGATGQNSTVIKKNAEAYRSVVRQQISLDKFCADRHLKPDVIKIDVEGGEYGVLQGAKAVLHESRPLIFLSTHPKELQLLGISEAALFELIDELGYTCVDMDGRPVTQFRLSEYLLHPKSDISNQ